MTLPWMNVNSATWFSGHPSLLFYLLFCCNEGRREEEGGGLGGWVGSQPNCLLSEAGSFVAGPHRKTNSTLPSHSLLQPVYSSQFGSSVWCVSACCGFFFQTVGGRSSCREATHTPGEHVNPHRHRHVCMRVTQSV